MTREQAKARLNDMMSLIAEKHERTIEQICKSNNIYYPPEQYTSVRGGKSTLIDEIYDEFDNNSAIASDMISTLNSAPCP